MPRTKPSRRPGPRRSKKNRCELDTGTAALGPAALRIAVRGKAVFGPAALGVAVRGKAGFGPATLGVAVRG